MRTIILVIVGLVLAAILLRAFGPQRRALAAALFTALWLLATLWNLSTGMSHGYSLAEEIPYQAAMFLIPVAGAWLAWAWGRRGRA